MKERSVLEKCGKLEYTQHNELDNETFDKTKKQIEELYSQYSVADVLGTLATIWPLKKAIDYFEKDIKKIEKKEIKTIGTFYYRIHNGGAERVQAQLLVLWRKMGYDVVLFTEEEASEYDYYYPSSVKRIIIPSQTKIVERLTTLQKSIEENNIDIFVNNMWLNSSILWECVLTRKLNVPYIQYIHGCFSWPIRSDCNKLYMTRIFKLCNLVLTLTETNARFYQMNGCETYLVQNPIPEDVLKIKSSKHHDCKHILMVGRLANEKRPLDAVKIFNLVHKKYPEIVLDVVGADDDGNMEKMKKYCIEEDILDNVIFHGEKKAEDVHAFFENSKCMLFTSEIEGYPMVLLEAKAHGLPIVMYDLSYLTMVKDSRGIYTSKIGDINECAKNILTVFEDNEHYTKLCKDARDSFEQFMKYDIEKAWREIFVLSTKNQDIEGMNAYYNPKNALPGDPYIGTLLSDAISKGFEWELANSRDYRIGNIILKFPRMIKRKIRTVIGVGDTGVKL